MSLLSDAMETFHMMDRQTTADGYGGFTSTYVGGAAFQAAVALKNYLERSVGMAAGTKGMYTITTHPNVNLQYHDVIRRESDGKLFRVTSNGDDNRTPESASLQMRNVDAEEWTVE